MKYFISSLLLACLLFAPPSWAAVSWDTDTTKQASSGTTDTFNHTIGTGSNVYVGVCLFTRNTTTAADVTSVTIDGSAGTHLGTANDATDGTNIRVEMWGRALGSKNGSIAVDSVWDRTDAPRIVAFSMFGVDQGTPVGTAQTATSTYPTSLSVNVSSAADELVASCLGLATSGTSITVGAGQTEQWLNTSTAANSTQDQGSTEPGGATVTMSHSWTTADYAALVAAPFKAATATATAQTLMLMGVGN